MAGADRQRVAGDRRLAEAVRHHPWIRLLRNGLPTCRELVTEVRRFRSDQGLADRQKVPARLAGVEESDLSTQVPAVTSLAWLTEPAAEFQAVGVAWRCG